MRSECRVKPVFRARSLSDVGHVALDVPQPDAIVEALMGAIDDPTPRALDFPAAAAADGPDGCVVDADDEYSTSFGFGGGGGGGKKTLPKRASAKSVKSK